MSRICVAIGLMAGVLVCTPGWRVDAHAAPFVPAQLATETADRSGSSPAADRGEPVATELAKHMLADLQDGTLHDFTLFQAALVAGGVESQLEMEQRTSRFEASCLTLRHELKLISDVAERSDRILRWLHAHLLTGDYRADCSALPRTLEQGDYNCVTATILFLELAAACDINACAIAADAHVLCAVRGEQVLYVETTCAEWETLPGGDCPPSTRHVAGRGRELTAVQLLGKVFYNQGVALLEAGEFAAAVELLRRADQLDEADAAARHNLLAALNNWALAECDRGAYRRAIELLQEGLAIDATFEPLRVNDLHIHQQWVRSLCGAGDFSNALKLIDDVRRRRPDSSWFDRGSAAVWEAWSRHQASPSAFQTHLPSASP